MQTTPEKYIYQLLIKESPTSSQIQTATEYLSKTFFKPLSTPIPYSNILPHIKMYEWQPQIKIFSETQKNQHIYFLLQGSINIYKTVYQENQCKDEIVANKAGPCIIGQPLLSHTGIRTFTVTTTDYESCYGFTLQRKIFERECAALFKQYKAVLMYLYNFLNLSADQFSKINLSEDIKVKTYLFGQKVQIHNQCHIVYEGQCQMNFLYDRPNSREDRQKMLYRVKKQKKNIFKPLVKLCQNQCFGMEKICQYGQRSERNSMKKQLLQIKKFDKIQYEYIASSERLVCILIEIPKLHLFPAQLFNRFREGYAFHLKKLKEHMCMRYQKTQIFDNNSSLSALFPKRNRSPFSLKESYISPIKQYSSNLPSINSSAIAVNETQQKKKLQKVKFTDITNRVTQLSPPNLKKYKLNNLPFLKNQSRLLDQTLKKSFFGNQSCSFLNKSDKLDDQNVKRFKKKFCLGYELKVKCEKQIQNHFLHQINIDNKSKQKTKEHQQKRDKQNANRIMQKQTSNHKDIQQLKGYFPLLGNKRSMKEEQKNSIKQKEKKQFSAKRKEWIYYVLKKKKNRRKK